MDTVLENGDFKLAENGYPYVSGGETELFQRASIRLKVPLGSFTLDAQLGSEFSTLKSEKEANRAGKALSLAQEALRNLPQVSAEKAEYTAGDSPFVTVTVKYGDNTEEIKVNI